MHIKRMRAPASRSPGPAGHDGEAGIARARPIHLNRSHPLAAIAAAHCRGHLGNGRRFGLSQVACGACWERAIRDDERFVVEFRLPRENGLDASYVDEVAVERACGGERVRLSPVELVAAVERLPSFLLQQGKQPGEDSAGGQDSVAVGGEAWWGPPLRLLDLGDRVTAHEQETPKFIPSESPGQPPMPDRGAEEIAGTSPGFQLSRRLGHWPPSPEVDNTYCPYPLLPWRDPSGSNGDGHRQTYRHQ